MVTYDDNTIGIKKPPTKDAEDIKEIMEAKKCEPYNIADDNRKLFNLIKLAP